MARNPLHNEVKRLRLARGGMTQEQLAAQAGVTRQTIIALEANRYSPSLTLAFRIARVLAVSLEEVFQYDDGDDADLTNG